MTAAEQAVAAPERAQVKAKVRVMKKKRASDPRLA
jgi:hypothetical protein